MSRHSSFAVCALFAVFLSACGARANQPPPERQVVWRSLGAWSGRGSTQTESFTSDTGTLRVRWETTAPADAAPAGRSAFRLTAHSAISGRPLQQVVDHDGVGNGIGYVQQDPHIFYMVVESNRVDWKFTVEEAVSVQGS